MAKSNDILRLDTAWANDEKQNFELYVMILSVESMSFMRMSSDDMVKYQIFLSLRHSNSTITF